MRESTSRRTAAGPSAATRAATSPTTSAPAADIYRVNTTTGERTLMLKNQLINVDRQHIFGISPDGNYFLYWKDNKFQAYDLDAATTQDARRRERRRASSTPSSITRARSRRTASPATRPTGKSVIVAARLRSVASCRSTARRRRNLTNGAGSKSEIRFRYVPHRAGSDRRRRRPAAAVAAAGAAARRARDTIDLVEADHAVGVRRVDEEGRLLRARRTAS